MRYKVRNFIKKGVPAALMVLGVSVMWGWAHHNTTLVQIDSCGPPMAPWSAWCFVWAGMGFSLWSRWGRGLCAAMVGLVGATELLQYCLNLQIPGFDQMWIDPWVGRFYAANILPGRMALSTSACFCLIALRIWKPYRTSHKVVGGSIALLGCISCWWYVLASMDLPYGPWGPWTDMAIHTGLAMCAIGVYILDRLDVPPMPCSYRTISKVLAAAIPYYMAAPVVVGGVTKCHLT